MLPEIALAADTLAQRARWLAPIVVLLLIIGIPGNIKPLATAAGQPPSLFAADKEMLLSLPRMPLARAVPRSLVPAPNGNYRPTLGWLLAALDSGRLPDPRPVTAVERATNTLRLSLQEVAASNSSPCQSLHQPALRMLNKGQSIRVHTGSVAVTLAFPVSQPLTFGGHGLAWFKDHLLVVVAGPLSLRIAPISGDAAIC